MTQNIKTKVVGVDISVDYTTFAIVDLRGIIVAQDRISTADYPNVNEYVNVLSEQIVLLVEANGGYESVRSVGISAPSGNFITGCIENPGNLPWKGVIPLAAMLRDRLGMAVALANDAHVSAIGEHVYGCAHGMKNFIVISLGHGGVGSCFFSDGVPHLGAVGSAGEVGHICVKDGGRLCGCGRKGCLEEYASARGIAQTVREVLAERTENSLLRSLEKPTPESVGLCFDQGDVLAREVYRRTGEMLGIGLSTYASVINPEAIIMTGELTRKAWPWLEESTLQSFDEHVFHNIRGKAPIMVSILNDSERDVVGASALAWEVEEYSLFK